MIISLYIPCNLPICGQSLSFYHGICQMIRFCLFVDQLLLSCHKLETLKLKWCQDLDYLKLPQALRKLVVRNCWSMMRIDVSGSSIESLRCDGRHLPASLLCGSTPALPAAKVDLPYSTHNRGNRFCHLKHADIRMYMTIFILSISFSTRNVGP
jgi:hypothetical protein